MKNIFVLIFCATLFAFLPQKAQCQSLGIYAGIGQPSYTDYKQEALEGAPSYSNKGKWATRYGFLGTSHLFKSRYWIKVGLGIETVKSNLLVTSSPLPKNFTSDIQIEKSSVQFALYPFNFRIFKHAEINIGYEFNFLLKQDVSGIRYRTQDYAQISDISNEVKDMNKKTTSGVRVNASYAFFLTKNMSVSPEYSVNFGLQNEFNKIWTKAKIVQHFLGINAFYHFGK
ncbi:MAG: hypothetical protein KBF75_04105 [Saprospiraceae bacterium]|nr:hypothetical protein [Saprospiraceae bacterium]